MLNIHEIVAESIVDGPGFRFAVFTQGCPHRCPGCHNPQTHSFVGGREISVAQLFEVFSQNRYLTGITFSGGEPFCQPEPLARLARLVHAAGKDVTVFTGFTLAQLCEQAQKKPEVAQLLEETDLLIDGPFIEAQRDLTLTFRGSRNQCIYKKEGGLWVADSRYG